LGKSLGFSAHSFSGTRTDVDASKCVTKCGKYTHYSIVFTLSKTCKQVNITLLIKSWSLN